MIRPKANNIIGFLLLLLWSAESDALTSDKEQVMNVVADSADLSQQEHKGLYLGHVEFRQGTSNIRATKARTEGNSKNQLSLAIAQGNKTEQAHYWTEPELDKPSFHAYADTIRYYPLQHRIEFEGNARIVQGKNSLCAAKISYDTLNHHLLSQNKGSVRTTLTFYPEQKQP